MGHSKSCIYNGKPGFHGQPLGSANGGASQGEAVIAMQWHIEAVDDVTVESKVSGGRLYKMHRFGDMVDDMAGGTMRAVKCSTVRDYQYKYALAKRQTSTDTNSKCGDNINSNTFGVKIQVIGETPGTGNYWEPGQYDSSATQPSHGKFEYYYNDDGWLGIYPYGGSGGPYKIGIKEVVTDSGSWQGWSGWSDDDRYGQIPNSGGSWTSFNNAPGTKGDHTNFTYYTINTSGAGSYGSERLFAKQLGGTGKYGKVSSTNFWPPVRPEYKIVVFDMGAADLVSDQSDTTADECTDAEASTFTYPNDNVAYKSFQFEFLIRIGVRPGGSSYYTWPTSNGYDLRSGWAMQDGTTEGNFTSFYNFSERANCAGVDPPNASHIRWSNWVYLNHPGKDRTGVTYKQYDDGTSGGWGDGSDASCPPTGT